MFILFYVHQYSEILVIEFCFLIFLIFIFYFLAIP